MHSRKISVEQQARINSHITQPYEEKEFYPLALFRGTPGLGRAKTVYNYFCAAMELELDSVAALSTRATASGGVTSELAHLTGIHSYQTLTPVFNKWGSRLLASPEVMIRRTPYLKQYLEFLRDEGGLRLIDLAPLDRWTTSTTVKKGQNWWRYKAAPRRRRTAAPTYKATPVAERWPYVSRDIDLSGMDLLTAVEAVVPIGLSEQIRADLCQDLIVAVLTGEIEQPNLADALPSFRTKVFRQFPMKYAAISLDAPIRETDNLTIGHLVPSIPSAIGMCLYCERGRDDLKDGVCGECWDGVERDLLAERRVTPGEATPPPRRVKPRKLLSSTIEDLVEDPEWEDEATAKRLVVVNGEQVAGHLRSRKRKPIIEDLDPAAPRKSKMMSGAQGRLNNRTIGVDYVYPRKKKGRIGKRQESRGSRRGDEHHYED